MSKRSLAQNTALFETYQWLRQQYWDEKKSVREMAKMLGSNYSTVLTWMRRFGIPRRTISESRKGDDHSLWRGGCVKYWGQQAHRIWEEHYNYKIPKGFIIHHGDEDGKNNNIENLVMLSIGLHGKVHSRIRREKNVTT